MVTLPDNSNKNLSENRDEVEDSELLDLIGESPCANAPAPDKETYDEFLLRLSKEQQRQDSPPN